MSHVSYPELVSNEGNLHPRSGAGNVATACTPPLPALETSQTRQRNLAPGPSNTTGSLPCADNLTLIEGNHARSSLIHNQYVRLTRHPVYMHSGVYNADISPHPSGFIDAETPGDARSSATLQHHQNDAASPPRAPAMPTCNVGGKRRSVS